MTHQGKSVELDLSVCDAEPIHIPGAIQPHGALLAASSDGLLVTHASANLLAILGLPPEAVLGRPLGQAIGEAACSALTGAMTGGGAAVRQMVTTPGANPRRLHLGAHRSGSHICVDIEPALAEGGRAPPVTTLQSVLQSFSRATTRQQLCELAVRGLKLISGFDRVIAYRIAADAHGEVIAEVREPELDSFLGLHFPAGDMPRQCRTMVMRNRVFGTPDFSYRPAALIPAAAGHDGAPIDLTYSSLRSISPYHREYMRNMKTAATLTVSLWHGLASEGPKLWGMLVCHHRTPRVTDPELRAVVEIIGEVVSLLIQSLGDAEAYAGRLARTGMLRLLTERLATPVLLPDLLAAAEAELLDLVEAGGAVVRLSGNLIYLGRTPPPEAAEQALTVLLAETGGAVAAVDDLVIRHPELSGCRDDGSGALLLPIAQGSGDAIIWFRPELARTVEWGGDPSKHVTADPVTGRLSPRLSFAAWKQTVGGRSAPWTSAEIAQAGELRTCIETAIARRTKDELVKLQLYDTLTGLPNRNLLQERLTRAEQERSETATLLFFDLDRTKTINDTMGYAAGDALLVEVARRLRIVAGEKHFVARLGGDEFVVLCGGLDRGAAAELGERIRREIEAPFAVGGHACNVSVSVGIAIVDQSGELAPGKAADMAMYAAMSNIGARQQAEAQRQKMESLGRMMGGVAHEINNMLQPVTLLAQDLIDNALVAPDGLTHLETVVDCTQKARLIIGDLLAFSRPTPRAVEVHDPAALLQESLRLVRQAVPTGVVLSLRIDGTPLPIAINRTTFVQIVLNLATNASAAMDGRGELTIVLDNDDHGPDKSTTTTHKGFVRLRVADTGCGMDKTTLERAFEPFFTTKPVGQGTGLGLPVVYGMVCEMGGTISLDSHPGRGTTVTILIPEHEGTL